MTRSAHLDVEMGLGESVREASPASSQAVLEALEAAGLVGAAPELEVPPVTRSPYFDVEMGFGESVSEASPASSQAVLEALEAAELAGATAELEDHESLMAAEGFATEPPEIHEAIQERLPEDHFAQMALEAQSLLNRFFERIEGYETEALTEAEIERAIAEIAPPRDPFAPASEQFLGDLVHAVGNFVSHTVKAVANTARSAAHAVADVSSSIADTLGKVPVIGAGLKGLYGYTYGAVIQAADNVVSGVRLDKVASRYFESQIHNVRDVAPYVQTVISLVPGIGPGISGAISAGLSLAEGKSIDQALVDAAVGALPGGALVQSAAKMTYAAASGEPISDIAVAALPLSPAAKEALNAGLRVASDLAQGKRVDKTLLTEVNRQIDRLPPQVRTAAQVGMALGQGKKLQDIATAQLPRLIGVGGPLAAAGQKIAAQSPAIQRARSLLEKEGQHGFDVAHGIMAQAGANVHQLERARAALRGQALRGFERAVALHAGYSLPLPKRQTRVPIPIRSAMTAHLKPPAGVRVLGRPIPVRPPGVRAPAPVVPVPSIGRPRVLSAVQHLPPASTLDEPPATTLDGRAAVLSDSTPAAPSDAAPVASSDAAPVALPDVSPATQISGSPTARQTTCPCCGGPLVADAADAPRDDGAVSSSEPVSNVSLVTTPTVGEVETPFELSSVAETPYPERRPPDTYEFEGTLEREGAFELGEVELSSPGRSAPEYVRWVQDTLNRTLGTKLSVDGRSGPATRAAIAQFQRLHKLNPDGVVGPATEAMLASGNAVPAPTAAGATASPSDSRARYASWSDADDRRKGRNPREQGVVTAGAGDAGNVLEFPQPDDVSQRIFLLQNFKVDGAALRPEHKQYLELLARWIRSRPQSDWQVFVEAHASRTGTERHDDVLSEDRYLVTRAFLESQLLRAGVEATRLRIYGEGVGFRHSPLPGEDPRTRSVYLVTQPNPSPFPPASWPPPIVPVPWPPVRPRPLPLPVSPPVVAATDISEYVSIDFVLEDLKATPLPSVFSRRPAFRDLASLTATPAGAMIAALKTGPIRIDPVDPAKFQTRVRMQLVFPASTADSTRPAGSGKLPLVVLVHGNHLHYAVSSGVLLEKESFRGYRYFQDELARSGVASISVDTNIANATGSLIELRADLVLEALKLLQRRASVQGSVLFNRFNFDRIAVMGHSRGGDAVIRVVKKNRAAPAASRFGILTACSLSPTDLTGGQVPGNRIFLEQYDLNFYSVLYGALDGDVSGTGGSNAVAGTGFRHYDRARCRKALVFAERCCHNSFNSVWHADGVENGVRSADRLSGKLVDEGTHQKLVVEYIGAQFIAELKGTMSMKNLFNGMTPSTTGLATAILWSFGNALWTLDDYENPAGNAAGGRRLNSGAVISDFGSIQIPAGVSINDHVLEQGHVVHADTALASASPFGVETTLPVGGRDVSTFTTLALDVGAFFDTTSEATINAGKPPTFSVILYDGSGATATAAGSSFSPTLRKPFFHVLASGKNVTALHLETLTMPLNAFRGIDLRNVVKVQVEVSPPSGHLFIDDIKLAEF